MDFVVKHSFFIFLVIGLLKNWTSCFVASENKNVIVGSKSEVAVQIIEMCITPSQPTNGQWFYLNKSEPALPFKYVNVNTTIGFKCNTGYELSSNESTNLATCMGGGMEGKWNMTRFPVCNSGPIKNKISENIEDSYKKVEAKPHVIVVTLARVMSKWCLLPSQPMNGQWFFVSNEYPSLTDNYAPADSVIGFQCNTGYEFASDSAKTIFVTCTEGKDGGPGKWNITQFPTCKPKICPPFYNTSVITVYCTNRATGLPVSCETAPHDTLLTYECSRYYEPSSPTQGDLQCYDGSWDYETIPLCVPECGRKTQKAVPLIIGGKISKLGKYPWVVAIYSSRESDPDFANICGGTIVTPSIVLTAAHCVSKLGNGRPYKARHFRVSAGKFYNEFEDDRDSNTTQTSEVKQILIHPEHKGERQQYRFDIALLKLKTEFLLSDIIQPVCYHEVKNYLPGKSAVGWVSGWGYTTSKGDSSDVLKEVSLPIRERKQCHQDFDKEWADQYFTDEKLCAGYQNQSTSVCKGDSGGGLVLQHPDTRRFYVYGIVSLAPSYLENNQKHCDIQKSALFTKVSSYLGWMQQNVAQLSCDGCQNSALGLSTVKCDLCFCFKQFCPVDISIPRVYTFKRVCGRKRINSKIINPWAVSLYTENVSDTSKNICGGTLITTDLVITAAHCLTSDKGVINKTLDYLVAAGKSFSSYMDSEDNDTQILKVERVVVHTDFRGKLGNYRDDIAILKLNGTFNLTTYVQPVCYEDLLTFLPEEDSLTSITALGYAKSDKPGIPKDLNLPIINYTSCYNEFDEDWAIRYVTTDKICAGNLDQDSGPCREDSGAGLVMKHPDTGRYYIHGVVSVLDIDENTSCSNKSATVFIDVSRYYEWIQDQIVQLSRIS